MQAYDLIVIGAGASGMAAAIAAASRGASVLILEKNKQVGRKIRMTGNGRCNFSNLRQGRFAYRGADPDFAVRAMEKFGLKETLDFFFDLGILPYEREGCLYPSTQEAASVQKALLCRLLKLGVSIHTGESCRGFAAVRQKDFRYRVTSVDLKSQSKGDYLCRSLLLASGGKAAPASGSTGDGYYWAEKLGHRIIPPAPALVSLKSEWPLLEDLAGLRLQAGVQLLIDGREAAYDRGEIQCNRDGISGIPVLQVSRDASYALNEGSLVSARLLILPWLAMEQRKEKLSEILFRVQKESLESCLQGILPGRLLGLLKEWTGYSLDRRVGGLDAREREDLLSRLLSLEIPIVGTGGYQQAQTTAGGLATDQFSSDSMESLLSPGFYAAGEVLDIDGICGGYNLQWAWTSGCLAGADIAGERHL